MTTFNLDENKALYQIKSYRLGQITVNETLFTTSLIVTPEKIIQDWPPQNVNDLTPESFLVIKNLKPDILLLGTGDQLIFVPLHLYGELINVGIGVEIMNTGAACRTYNALSAENRHVAAALIIR